MKHQSTKKVFWNVRISSNWCHLTHLDEIGHFYWPEFFWRIFPPVIYNSVLKNICTISMTPWKFETIGRLSAFRFVDFLEIRLYESKLYELKNCMSWNYMSWNYMSWNYMSRNYMKCYWALFHSTSSHLTYRTILLIPAWGSLLRLLFTSYGHSMHYSQSNLYKRILIRKTSQTLFYRSLWVMTFVT